MLSRSRNICRGFLNVLKKPNIGFLNKVHLVGGETLISEKMHGELRIKNKQVFYKPINPTNVSSGNNKIFYHHRK
jgi:hypothetical protein